LFYMEDDVCLAIDQGTKFIRYHLHGMELSSEDLQNIPIDDVMIGDVLTVRIERTINDKTIVARGARKAYRI